MQASSSRVLLSDFRQPDISAEIPFLFKRAGCTVELYCAQSSWLRKNSYFDTWHEADTSSKEAYAKGLAELVGNTPYDWVVLTEDEAIEAANTYIKNEAIVAQVLPIKSLEHRELLASKANLSLLAKKCGLATPLFSIYDEHKESFEIPFPLLVKIDRSSGGEGVFFCADEPELRQRLADLSSISKKNLVLQKYIAGQNLSVEALFKDGVLLMQACSKLEEALDTEFSVSLKRLYYRDDALAAQVREVGAVLGLNGFGTLTFMEDANTGKRYLIEADTRPNIWFAVLRRIGIDFSVGIRDYLGMSPGTEESQPQLPSSVWQFHRDINRSIERGDFKNILKWVCNRDGRWAFVCWYDQRLFWATLATMVRLKARQHAKSCAFLRRLKRALR